MSRGFVREDDQEEPVFIPPRAPLPAGVDNLVTPRGLGLLQEERSALELQRTRLDLPDGPARRRELAEINGRIHLLEERIASARVVEPGDTGTPAVRFGTTVTFRIIAGPQSGTERRFTLVGVDEARVAEGRIAFTSPLAKALLGMRPGDQTDFQLGSQRQRLEVVSVTR